MLGGTVTHLTLSLIEWDRLGLEPFIWDQLGAALALVVVTSLTKTPEQELVTKYFSKQSVD